MATVLRLTDRIIGMADDDSRKNPLFIGISPCTRPRVARRSTKRVLRNGGLEGGFPRGRSARAELQPADASGRHFLHVRTGNPVRGSASR